MVSKACIYSRRKEWAEEHSLQEGRAVSAATVCVSARNGRRSSLHASDVGVDALHFRLDRGRLEPSSEVVSGRASCGSGGLCHRDGV